MKATKTSEGGANSLSFPLALPTPVSDVRLPRELETRTSQTHFVTIVYDTTDSTEDTLYSEAATHEDEGRRAQ